MAAITDAWKSITPPGAPCSIVHPTNAEELRCRRLPHPDSQGKGTRRAVRRRSYHETVFDGRSDGPRTRLTACRIPERMIAPQGNSTPAIQRRHNGVVFAER